VQDLPGGGGRLICDAIGIDAVIVNGVVLRRHGRDQCGDQRLPGKLLRGGCAAT
jgi:N-acyl-D-aspartate/D-glutamate deacylase